MAPRPSSPIISYLPSVFRAHSAKRHAGSTPLAHKPAILTDTHSTLSHFIAGRWCSNRLLLKRRPLFAEIAVLHLDLLDNIGEGAILSNLCSLRRFAAGNVARF